MNKIILLGRLVKDPEIKYTSSEKCVAQFPVAVNRPTKNAEGQYEADFINIVAWNKTAELIGNYVHKGQRILVEGRLQIRSYTAQDGGKRSVTEVIADRVEFVESKAKNGTEGKQSDFGGMGAAQPFDMNIPF